MGVGSWQLGVREAYEACERIARAHYENFPVASLLLPPRMRPHVAAVYAFARAADDFADEGTIPPEERLRLLDSWQQRLHHAAESSETGPPPVPVVLVASPPNVTAKPGETVSAGNFTVSNPSGAAQNITRVTVTFTSGVAQVTGVPGTTFRPARRRSCAS